MLICFRLAEYVREHAPEFNDDHLFTVEAHVRRKVAEKCLDLELLMGPPVPEVKPVENLLEEEETMQLPPFNASDFLDHTKLRCLGI